MAPSRAASLLVPCASRVAVPAGGGLTGQRAVISRSPPYRPYPLHSPGPAIPVRPSPIEQRPSPKAPASGETVTWRGRRPVLSEVTHLVRLGRCCDGMWSLEASRAWRIKKRGCRRAVATALLPFSVIVLHRQAGGDDLSGCPPHRRIPTCDCYPTRLLEHSCGAAPYACAPACCHAHRKQTAEEQKCRVHCRSVTQMIRFAVSFVD
jgi:hypothetical protein